MESFDRFVAIIRQLREPGGCPWDIEQTFASLTPHIIEEAYELAEAMRREDAVALREELGDVLLHVVMVSEMAAEQGWFTVADVVGGITDKMIRRHPHVFGDVVVTSSEDVVSNWDTIKISEKSRSDSIFESIPSALPALMRAQKIQKRVSREGFDWPTMEGALAKLKEEIAEFEVAVAESQGRVEEEFGDMLFSMVNVARHVSVLSENALQSANDKFMTRYLMMLALVRDCGKSFEALSLDDKEYYWNLAKQKLAEEALQ